MTIVILALLTLIEGMRRVPSGSVVLQRVLFGPWRVEQREARERLRLLSWWSPFMSTIVLAPRDTPARTDGDAVRAQLDGRLHTTLFDLRLLGLVELLALVVGLPLALERFGARGFLWAAYAVIVLCLTVFATLVVGGRALGKPTRAALRWSLPFLSPFAAPRAAEALFEAALRDVAPGVVSSVLVPADAFLVWVRPLVYDASHGGTVDRRLLDGLDLRELRAALAQRPGGETQNGEGAWCPRCGATFIRGDSCSECDIELVAESPAIWH